MPRYRRAGTAPRPRLPDDDTSDFANAALLEPSDVPHFGDLAMLKPEKIIQSVGFAERHSSI